MQNARVQWKASTFQAHSEFGQAAAFLLSEASAYTTGASLQVDGGMIKGVL